MAGYYYPYGGGRKAKFGERLSELLCSAEYLLCRMFRLRILCIDAYSRMLYGKVDNANLGDDLNLCFLPRISKVRFLPFKYIRKISSCFGDVPVVHYFIGSVLNMVEEPGSMVWGSGLLTEDQLPKCSPNILAVRGPRTRDVLLSNGIPCPEVYGDPALLLPYYYSPRNTKKRYKLGIVPHYVDSDKIELNHFKESDGVLIINVTGYSSWRDVIDKISSCEAIASSSLHGIIISEAYGIPNKWVEIREPIIGDKGRRFKFYDFYESVGKKAECPYVVDDGTTVVEMLGVIKNTWSPSCFSIKPLVDACPFSLKPPIIPFK